MFESLLDLISDWFLVILSGGILVFALLFISVFAALALAGSYATPPVRFRFPPARVSLWKLMAAILVFGTLLDVVVMGRRAIHAYKKAEHHGDKVSLYRLFQGRDDSTLGPLLNFMGGVWTPEQLEYLRTVESYHDRMREKYHDVASHPWRSVSPDPPPPELKFHAVFSQLEAK
jgi:hypothetical protein